MVHQLGLDDSLPMSVASITRNSPLVLASNNAHKILEVTRILSSLGVTRELISMDAAAAQVGVRIPEIVEDGATFEENALIKARTVARLTQLQTIADDSGICVDSLNGMPGIFSARWAGTHGDDQANLDLLLAQIGDVPADRRGAAFVCAIALVTPVAAAELQEAVVVGEVQGSLLRERSGANGFGYDPIFVPTGFDRTTAQMSSEEKDQLSHRRRALAKIATQL